MILFAKEEIIIIIRKKRYKQDYRWFIEREHINLPHEIFDELSPYFSLAQSTYFRESYVVTPLTNPWECAQVDDKDPGIARRETVGNRR